MILVYQNNRVIATFKNAPAGALESAYPDAAIIPLDLVPNWVPRNDGFYPGNLAANQPAGFAEATGLTLVNGEWILTSQEEARWSKRANRNKSSKQKAKQMLTSAAIRQINSPGDAEDYVQANVDTSSTANAIRDLGLLLAKVIFIIIMVARFVWSERARSDDDIYPEDE